MIKIWVKNGKARLTTLFELANPSAVVQFYISTYLFAGSKCGLDKSSPYIR
jgi:hypothetical protein